MSDNRSTKQLFRAWRDGDAEAGQAMAQRFADWYYAIASSRLGDQQGAGPCERACASFGRGVVDVTDARSLVNWAHDIIAKEVADAGGRTANADIANAYSAHRRPKDLLNRAAQAKPAQVALLEAAYGNKHSEADLEELCKDSGGFPLGVLRARYQVKAWLRDSQGIPFSVAPEEPVLDRAPMPLYEAGRMASEAEEVQFEKWMLTDLELLRDIAEFATFAVALRGGLAPTGATPPPAEPRAERNSDRMAVPEPTNDGNTAMSTGGLAAAGGLVVMGGVAALVVVGGLAAWFLLG